MGLFIAFLILAAWSANLIYSLVYQSIMLIDPMFWIHWLLQIWLYTGLFITAHDAMHNTISRNSRLNYSIGFISTFLFAGMYYPKLLTKHHLHHAHPATAKDPDFKIGNQNFFVWWFSFLKQYITVWQIFIMAIIFNVLLLFFTELQLIVFWVIPSILATFQLFYFGTFLPHRLPHTENMQPHNSRTLAPNHVWALISCYFFGYHSEHHASPGTPWWKLYQVKNQGIRNLNNESEKK